MTVQPFRLSIKQKAKELTELKGYSASIRIGVFIGLVFWLLFFSTTFVQNLRNSFDEDYHYQFSNSVVVHSSSVWPNLLTVCLMTFLVLILYSLAYQYYHKYQSLNYGLTDFFNFLKDKSLWKTLLIQVLWGFVLIVVAMVFLMIAIPIIILLVTLLFNGFAVNSASYTLLLIIMSFAVYQVFLLFIIYVSIRFYFTAIATYDCLENGLIKERGYDYGIRYSWRITKGRVFELVKLWLSLLGWFFLIMITAGIALFFIAPYLVGIHVMAYERLKEDYEHSLANHKTVLTNSLGKGVQAN